MPNPKAKTLRETILDLVYKLDKIKETRQRHSVTISTDDFIDLQLLAQKLLRQYLDEVAFDPECPCGDCQKLGKFYKPKPWVM